jgi:hypothetical protein
MAITTDSYVDIESGGITYDRIGLSKTLDNYTIDEIKDYHYCSMSNPLFRQLDVKKNIYSTAEYASMPNTVTGTYDNVYVGAGSSAYKDPSGAYSTVYWLDGTPAPYITEDSLQYYKMVTEWDASKYVFDISTMLGTASFAASVWANTWDDLNKMMYAADPDNSAGITYHSKLGKTGDIEIAAGSYLPYGMCTVDGKLLFYQLSQAYNLSVMTTAEDPNYINHGYYADYDEEDIICVNSPSQVMKENNDYSDAGDAYENPWPWGHPIIIPISRYTYSTDDLFCQYYLITGNEIRVYTWLRGKNQALQFWANCGLHIKAGSTIYKPIIWSGYVGGYTDQLDTVSDIDDWSGSTQHDVAPAPPPPPPPGADDDNTDPISTADAPFGAGIAHYYAMTADSVLLQHVSEALGTWDIDSSKKDLYRNLISCKLLKPPAPIPVSGSEDFTIYGVVPQYQGAGVKLPVINGNPSNTFGPYSITRKFNDFRDFAPYSKAEIFLPYCGWTPLPSHVIGRSVTVKYFTDIIAATCKALVFCNNNVVAEAAGIIGIDIPFAAENVGAKMEAANMGLLSSTLGAVQTAVGVGTMVSTKSGSGMKNVTSGLSQVISGCTQISMAGNENWTEINGKAGDGCSLSGITNIIIKITRPKYGSFSTPPYVPSGYAHNIGYVAMKQTKPGNVSGLLVCDNVDTSGISGATQRERELIKAYMESGIIVNAAPSP